MKWQLIPGPSYKLNFLVLIHFNLLMFILYVLYGSGLKPVIRTRGVGREVFQRYSSVSELLLGRVQHIILYFEVTANKLDLTPKENAR